MVNIFLIKRAGSVVVNCSIQGLIIYTGEDSKIMMGDDDSTAKRCKNDEEINTQSKMLFIIMTLMGFVLITIKGYGENWVIQFFRYILLLCSIIPLSLKVNQDLSKLYFSYRIRHDEEIEGTEARNSSIAEDLGRIDYILTDKTGTLTKNDMIMRKIAVQGQIYETSSPEVKSLISGAYGSGLGLGLEARGKSDELRNYLNLLLLCHSVIPDINSHGERVLDSASPDEVAFIEYLEKEGFYLERRSDKEIIIKIPGGERYSVEILAVFPFSSGRARMGVVVKFEGKIFLMMKGADSKMINIMKKEKKDLVEKKTSILSKEGLRTLVLAQKELNQSQFQNWKAGYEKALASLKNRDEKVEIELEKIETGLNYIGVNFFL